MKRKRKRHLRLVTKNPQMPYLLHSAGIRGNIIDAEKNGDMITDKMDRRK